MKKTALILLTTWFLSQGFSQEFGQLPKIDREKLLLDLDILYQSLDQFHSGMYWYTPKDSVDAAFGIVREQINRPMNLLEFHKLIAPLVALSREDHTDIELPRYITDQISRGETGVFLPLRVVFLGHRLYCLQNGSDDTLAIENLEITSINGETPEAIVDKIGSLFASDGYIKQVKYSDLRNFNFSRYYFYFYGNIPSFEIKFESLPETVHLTALAADHISRNLKERYPSARSDRPPLEFSTLGNQTAYLGIHTFSNTTIERESSYKTLDHFLQQSFRTIHRDSIHNLIIDISRNGGGSESNEGLLYSYFGSNYRKYTKVWVKARKVTADNGTDAPIRLKAFGITERMLQNRKMRDGSLERKKHAGFGLMAFKKDPGFRFHGTTYILISPVTYSGGSEFANMMYSNNLATFVGQETGGGYYGNTSGYNRMLTLPHSAIMVHIPALRFVMNVAPKLPFGSGVPPHFEVIPTIEEYTSGENAALNYVLQLIED